MASKENIYFLRSFLLLIEGGLYISKEILRRQCQKPGTDLDELLKHSKQKLRHSFHVNQYKKLYPEFGKADANSWDLQLSVGVLINVFGKDLKSGEKVKLKVLRDLRNDIYMHCTTAALDESKYEDVIEDLSDTITTLASTFDISVQQHCSNCIKQFTTGPLEAVRPSLQTLNGFSQSCQKKLKVGVQTELVIGGPSTNWISLCEHTLVTIFNHAASMASEDSGFQEIERNVMKMLSFFESNKATIFKTCERKCIILFFECKDYESFLNFLCKVECQEYTSYLCDLSNSLHSFFKPRNRISITSKVTSESLQSVLIDIIRSFSNEEEDQRHVVEISSEENIHKNMAIASRDEKKETKLINNRETSLLLNLELISLEALPQMLQSFQGKQFSDSLKKVAGSLSRHYGAEITLKASMNVGAVLGALEESVSNEITVDRATKKNTPIEDDFLLVSDDDSIQMEQAEGTETIYTSDFTDDDSIKMEQTEGTETIYTSDFTDDDSVQMKQTEGTETKYTSDSTDDDSNHMKQSEGTETKYTSDSTDDDSNQMKQPEGTETKYTSDTTDDDSIQMKPTEGTETIYTSIPTDKEKYFQADKVRIIKSVRKLRKTRAIILEDMMDVLSRNGLLTYPHWEHFGITSKRNADIFIALVLTRPMELLKGFQQYLQDNNLIVSASVTSKDIAVLSDLEGSMKGLCFRPNGVKPLINFTSQQKNLFLQELENANDIAASLLSMMMISGKEFLEISQQPSRGKSITVLLDILEKCSEKHLVDFCKALEENGYKNVPEDLVRIRQVEPRLPWSFSKRNRSRFMKKNIRTLQLDKPVLQKAEDQYFVAKVPTEQEILQKDTHVFDTDRYDEHDECYGMHRSDEPVNVSVEKRKSLPEKSEMDPPKTEGQHIKATQFEEPAFQQDKYQHSLTEVPEKFSWNEMDLPKTEGQHIKATQSGEHALQQVPEKFSWNEMNLPKTEGQHIKATQSGEHALQQDYLETDRYGDHGECYGMYRRYEPVNISVKTRNSLPEKSSWNEMDLPKTQGQHIKATQSGEHALQHDKYQHTITKVQEWPIFIPKLHSARYGMQMRRMRTQGDLLQKREKIVDQDVKWTEELKFSQLGTFVPKPDKDKMNETDWEEEFELFDGHSKIDNKPEGQKGKQRKGRRHKHKTNPRSMTSEEWKTSKKGN